MRVGALKIDRFFRNNSEGGSAGWFVKFSYAIMAGMQELNKWFLKNRRSFPWRESPTPYKVWISEVMLQQTRANVVVPYFERWITLFPTVQALAEAPLEEVIKAWEGLGYYSRARNLHFGAKQIMHEFQGEVPSSRKNLESIRGIGPYTVGAILSFGFRQRAAAIDGNVTRVLSRYFLIEENISKSSVKRKIQEIAEGLLDQHKPWVTTEALIELGATVCLPKPRCSECPISQTCKASHLGKAEILPIKNGEQTIIQLKRTVVLIEADGMLLLKKGEAGKVMADLYEFPYFEMDNKRWAEREVIMMVEKIFGLETEVIEKLKETSHTFTRYKAHLYPFRLKAFSRPIIEGHQWVPYKELSNLPFSSGHRRILKG